MSKKGENIYKRKDGRWEARYKKKVAENGRIVYTDTTYVDKMPSDKTRAFKFENYDPWPEHDKVEFYGGGR